MKRRQDCPRVFFDLVSSERPKYNGRNCKLLRSILKRREFLRVVFAPNIFKVLTTGSSRRTLYRYNTRRAQNRRFDSDNAFELPNSDGVYLGQNLKHTK